MADATTWDMRLCMLYNKLFEFRKNDRFIKQCADMATRWKEDRGGAGRASVEGACAKAGSFLRIFPGVDLAGRRVLDFGCGCGGASLSYARRGASAVIGVDVDAGAIEIAREVVPGLLAEGPAESGRLVEFRLGGDRSIPVEDGSVDVILSEDAVEHLADPEAIFREWRRVLAPGGKVLLSFGPLWYHPHGEHLWDVFPGPWSHVIFPERACVRVRHLRRGSASSGERWSDIGMNRMTLGWFKRLVGESGFRVGFLRAHAAWGLKPLLALPGVNELFVSQIDCLLDKSD